MKVFSKTFILLIFSSFLLSWYPAEKAGNPNKPEVKNIIFLIGDGMGLATVYAAMTVSDRPLNFERCTHVGLQKTFSADKYITDSAASGTALATGKKTNNGMIGVGPDGEVYKSILEIADERGKATGLVSSSTITHATPASFISHNSSRGNSEAIAMDFLKTDIDVFIGGGYDDFAKRSDNLNLLDSLKNRGCQIETSLEMILRSEARKLVGLTVPGNEPYRLQGRGNMLPAATGKAIEILNRNPKGFFLMVEGSQIDWAGHANDTKTIIDETLDFDEVIGLALDFAAKDGHTLVVITGDHETGGVTIIGGDMVKREVKLNFSSKGHTAEMLPVYAFGPGSENFSGIYDNTEVFEKFIKCYGF